MDQIDPFFSVGTDWASLGRPAPGSRISALERLGAWPFSRGSFPCLGFLATVYDQVAVRAEDLLKQAGD